MSWIDGSPHSLVSENADSAPNSTTNSGPGFGSTVVAVNTNDDNSSSSSSSSSNKRARLDNNTFSMAFRIDGDASMDLDDADLQQQQQQQQQQQETRAGEYQHAPPVLVMNPGLDLDLYATGYKGHTKIDRLVFIGDVCPSLRVDAFRLALAEIKKTLNYGRYVSVIAKLNQTLKDAGKPIDPVDNEWIDHTQKQARIRNEKLENELRSYKNNLIKESIRMGYNDLGDHAFDSGDLNTALKCYSKTRDYCTSSKHIVNMCLNVIKVSILMQNFVHVSNFVIKAESTPDVTDKAILISKLRCAQGLADIKVGKFKQAARHFLEVSSKLQDGYNEIISPQDIAIYTGLCALASFDRQDLKVSILDSAEFKQYLELVPEIREALHDFYNSRYTSLLNRLERLKPDLLLDIYLHNHVQTLYEEIRKRSLIQYFSPFVSVDLHKMAAAFNSKVPDLENELARLIMDRAIQARIDSHAKILQARQVDERVNTFENTLAKGANHIRDAKAIQLHLKLLKTNLCVE